MPPRLPLRGRDRRSVWRRGVARKTLAAALLGTAVYAATTALAPASPDPGSAVLVAGSDVSVGATLGPESVRTARVPDHLVPDGALTDSAEAHGAVTTAPLRAGEILTDVRIAPDGPLEGLEPDLVLTHLPLSVPELAGTLHPGLRVDVLTTVDGTVLAQDVLLVQQVSGPEASSEALSFLVAVTSKEASRLAVAGSSDQPGAGLTVVLRR
nr:SAF domain-containing protein [Ornithinimicrobium sp. HY1793]